MSNTYNKILVFGKTGQLATALAAMSSESCQMVFLSRLECDLSDVDQINKQIHDYHPDVVINAAAYTAVDKAESEKELAYQVNARAPEKMAKACAELGAAFIHVSTDYVFDGNGDNFKQTDDAVNPLGVYGESKLEGERRVLGALPMAVIIRTSWVYGDQGNNFVRTMIRLAESRDELGIVADQFGRPTYAADLADVIMKIVPQLENDCGGVYHFSNGGPVTSWHGFALEIFNQAGIKDLKVPEVIKAITTEEFPTPAKRPAWSVLSLDKIQDTFSISIPDWQTSLSNYFHKNY